MAPGVDDTSEFKIEVIPANEQGCRFYLERYKPFRLAALQYDADAFGSTYAREINFDDDAWLGRIKNPSAKTFVALRSSDDEVVASTSLIGPLPNTGPASNPYHVLSEMRPRADQQEKDADAGGEPLCFQMAAVYTTPSNRGRGLAKALIKAATEEAIQQAQAQARPLVLSVVVYAANNAAISVYERCGFVRSAGKARLVFNAFKNSSAEEISMYYSGSFSS
ncbi:hypothetical protein F5Y19DRAFT_94624 [Xylariaceae sp. FL1651]|nr:hypothetical protein F5Y19DRAFT_94624 [Xylariaceae sp. FL1651]